MNRETLRVFINQRNDIPDVKIGEPALFWHPSMRLFVEPTSFIHDRYCNTARSVSPHTWKAIAHSLVIWFDYLSQIGIVDWKTACCDHLRTYLNAYSTAISPKTHKPYTNGTKANRILPVIHFYEDARHKGLYSGDIAPVGESTGANGQATSSSMAYDYVPPRRSNRTRIRPFAVEQYKSFVSVVGPRPSKRAENDCRPTRDRLIVDTGVFVGLRLDEIRKLTRHQFQAVTPDPAAENVYYPVVVIGKGSKGSGPQRRPVAVPAWLIIEINKYIEGERSQAIAAGKAQDPGTLFVSGLESNSPGRPMSARRYEQIVEEGCFKSGLVEVEQRTDPATGQTYEVKIPKHCFHDLRHTYVVWTYWVEIEAGNTEPWKKIQAQVGHVLLSTTTDTYLHFVEIFQGVYRAVNVRKLLGL